MIRHIEFCLQEIEAEIDAQGETGLSEAGRIGLAQHIAGLRCLLADWQATAVAMTTGDRLTLIRGIDKETARLLASKRVTRFQTIADWRRADMLALADETLTLDRIASENWIEQAAILATGKLTHHARQIELARIATLDALEAELSALTTRPPTEIAATSPADTVSAPQVAAIAAALAHSASDTPAAAAAPDATAPAPLENIVALDTGRRTTLARRAAHVAAALALVATIGALQAWKGPSLIAMTTAVAAHVQPR